MQTITATDARSSIYNLIDELHINNEPIKITWKRSNAVIISEENWNAISETLYLLSVPWMRESIQEWLNTPISKCSDKLSW